MNGEGQSYNHKKCLGSARAYNQKKCHNRGGVKHIIIKVPQAGRDGINSYIGAVGEVAWGEGSGIVQS